jgi:O-antigen/teichoic acid export membrane protein
LARLSLEGGARAVARNLGWLLASRGVIAVLSLFYLGFATRALGVVGFGRFALITGAAQTLAALVAFQTWQVIVQFGVGADEGRLARLFRACALLDLLSALVGAVLAAAILLIWGEALGIGPTLRRATMIFVVVELVTVRSTPLGILRLRNRFAWGAAAESGLAVTRFVGAGIALLVHPTVQGFLVVWMVAELVTAGVHWAMVARTGDLRLLREGRGSFAQVLAEYPGLLRFALSTNASSTLNTAAKQVPLLSVGAALGPAAAGTFRLAAQLAQALAKLSQLVARAAFPELVRAVRAAEPAKLRRMLLRTTGASLAGGAAIMLLVLLVGEPVLRLVGGRGFGNGYPVLLAMAGAGCIELTVVGLDTVMTAQGRALSVLLIRLAALGVLGAAATVAVPMWGTLGMGLAVLAGSAAAAAMLAAATLAPGQRGFRSAR